MTVVLTINDTGKPKRDIVEMAYEECGSAGYVFERTPEEINSALRKLNAMMHEWPWDQLGFAQPTYGVGLPEDLSGLPDDSVHTVAAYLALRICPPMGKTFPAESKAALARSYTLLVSKYGGGPPTAYLAPNTPRGSGRRRLEPFVSEYPAS